MLSPVILFLALAIAALVATVAFFRRRERFTDAPPSPSPASVFDLAEFVALPTGFRDLLRAQLATLVGALTVKLSDLYTSNPAYVKTALEELTSKGIATILEYSVPHPAPPKPKSAPGVSASPFDAPPPAPAPTLGPGPGVETFMA